MGRQAKVVQADSVLAGLGYTSDQLLAIKT